MSGLINTTTLDLVTAAFTSGFMNVGEHLSGLIFKGVGP